MDVDLTKNEKLFNLINDIYNNLKFYTDIRKISWWDDNLLFLSFDCLNRNNKVVLRVYFDADSIEPVSYECYIDDNNNNHVFEELYEEDDIEEAISHLKKLLNDLKQHKILFDDFFSKYNIPIHKEKDNGN